MYYNDATNSYVSDYLENILDTKYKCDIPYKIDKEKYKNILEKYRIKPRIIDADVVTFNLDYYNNEDGEFRNKTLFAWPKNSPKNSEDFYECCQFDDYSDKTNVKNFKNFVHEFLDCIIGIDFEYSKKEMEKLLTDMKKLTYNYIEIANLINNETRS